MMTHGDGKGRCDMLHERGRAAVERAREKYERRVAELAEKELEMIELENAREMLCDALEHAERLLADDQELLSRSERAGLKERLSSLPTEIVLAEQCISLLRQIVEKTRTIAELERRDAESWIIG
jgi:hypothetical protein